MATVKARIVSELLARLRAHALVGVAVDAAAALAGESDDAIAKAVTDGKFAAEVIVFDDRRANAETINLEDWSFDVAVIGHLPDDLKAGSPTARAPHEVASDFDALVYRLYASADPSSVLHTWGGVALETARTGGGGVAVGARGTRETISVMRITYRHTFGDPEVAA